MAHTIVSIDIGSGLTKVLEGRFDKGALEIQRMESFKTPFREGEVHEQAFFEQLEKIVPLARLKSSEVAISVPTLAINLNVFSVPKLSRDELNQIIPREARSKIIPPPVSDDIIDYVILKSDKSKSSDRLSIFSGVGKRMVIKKYFTLFEKQGVIPQLVANTPLAGIAHFQEEKASPAESWAVIDIGFRCTSVLIMNKGEPALVRNIQIAAYDFVDAVAKKTGKGFAEAEKLFFEGPIDEALVQGSWQYLLSELRRSLAYFKEITAGEGIVEHIQFSGSLFKAHHAFDYLKKNMGGKLEIFTIAPSKRVVLKGPLPEDLSANSMLYATAFGMALSLNRKNPLPNFLPQAGAPRHKIISRIQLLSTRVMVIAAGVLFILAAVFGVQAQFGRAKVDKLKKEVPEAEYQRIMKKAKEVDGKLANVRRQEELLAIFSHEHVPWQGLFKVIGESMDEKGFAEEITVQKSGALTSLSSPLEVDMELKGFVAQGYDDALGGFNEFVSNLKRSGLFDGIVFGFSDNDMKVQVKGRELLTGFEKRDFHVNGKVKVR